MSDSDDFVYVTYIATTREKLWDALKNPEFTRQYWNGRILETDWRVGSTITIRHDYDDAFDPPKTVIEVDPPRRLVYGTPADESAGIPEQLTGFELTPMGDVVMLTVTSTGFKRGTREYQMVSGGWSFILSNLKTLLESGEIMPMDEKVLAAYR